MNKLFLRKKLSHRKSILNELFDEREELLSERIGVTTQDKQEFLETVEKVENEVLKKQLKKAYFQEEDIIGTECANLCKQYYYNGFMDSTNLMLECISRGNLK